jgi:hypothetical protein
VRRAAGRFARPLCIGAGGFFVTVSPSASGLHFKSIYEVAYKYVISAIAYKSAFWRFGGPAICHDQQGDQLYRQIADPFTDRRHAGGCRTRADTGSISIEDSSASAKLFARDNCEPRRKNAL